MIFYYLYFTPFDVACRRYHAAFMLLITLMPRHFRFRHIVAIDLMR